MGLGKQHSFKWAGHIVVRFPNPLASWQLGNLTSHIAILTARQQSVWFDAMKRTSLNSSQLKLEGTLPYSAVRGIHPNWWVAAKKRISCFVLWHNFGWNSDEFDWSSKGGWRAMASVKHFPPTMTRSKITIWKGNTITQRQMMKYSNTGR